METLSRLVHKACEVGLLEGFHVDNSQSSVVSHLLFASNTSIFCRPCVTDMGYLRFILLLFEAMSRHRVNLSKSSLIRIGEVPNIHYLAHFFGCGVSALLIWAFPLGASLKCKAVWDPVVERFQKRLAVWNSKMLSRRGRLAFLQVTLWSLPIYYMSLFTILASIASQLEKSMREFLWSLHASVNGFQLVGMRFVVPRRMVS